MIQVGHCFRTALHDRERTALKEGDYSISIPPEREQRSAWNQELHAPLTSDQRRHKEYAAQLDRLGYWPAKSAASKTAQRLADIKAQAELAVGGPFPRPVPALVPVPSQGANAFQHSSFTTSAFANAPYVRTKKSVTLKLDEGLIDPKLVDEWVTQHSDPSYNLSLRTTIEVPTLRVLDAWVEAYRLANPEEACVKRLR